MIYKVWVCLEADYDDIEADSEEEAFQIASDAYIALILQMEVVSAAER